MLQTDFVTWCCLLHCLLLVDAGIDSCVWLCPPCVQISQHNMCLQFNGELLHSLLIHIHEIWPYCVQNTTELNQNRSVYFEQPFSAGQLSASMYQKRLLGLEGFAWQAPKG